MAVIIIIIINKDSLFQFIIDATDSIFTSQ